MNEEREHEILSKVIAAHLPISLEYLATYDAVVVAQNSDGSLDLRLDDPKMPGLSSVPIFLGLPGIRVEVQKGAPVKVGFSSGDPSKPFVGLWATDAAFLRIILGGGTRAVARVDDETDSGTLVFRTVTQPAPACTVEWKPPGVEVPIVLGVLGVMVTANSLVEVPLSGVITTGLEKVLG
jgi:hypothetical protein